MSLYLPIIYLNVEHGNPGFGVRQHEFYTYELLLSVNSGKGLSRWDNESKLFTAGSGT